MIFIENLLTYNKER